MLRRSTRSLTYIFIVLVGFNLQAQVILNSGEVNLRGTLIHEKHKDYRLVINAETRAMKTIDLNSQELKNALSEYQSGTFVEVCVDILQAQDKNNLQSKLVKIRPLSPDEAVLIYTEEINTCVPGKGCKNFGNFILAPMFSMNLDLKNLPTDYLACAK